MESCEREQTKLAPHCRAQELRGQKPQVQPPSQDSNKLEAFPPDLALYKQTFDFVHVCT